MTGAGRLSKWGKVTWVVTQQVGSGQREIGIHEGETQQVEEQTKRYRIGYDP